MLNVPSVDINREGVSLGVLETERLVLRWMTAADAQFIFKLVNEPSFLSFIGDKGVRNHADAVQYIQNGPVASYKRFGFGLYLVELKETRVPIGICGLVKRDSLPNVDIGFAFLPAFWSKGYAFEAAAAVKAYGKDFLGISRLVAITNPDNESSGRLLEKIGLRFEGMIRLSEDSSEVKLFASDV